MTKDEHEKRRQAEIARLKRKFGPDPRETMTTQPKQGHTPGPLKIYQVVVNNAPSQWHVGTGKWGAGSVAVVDSEENAVLFAAAPDLLAACKRSEKLLKEMQVMGGIMEELRYAIAKAEKAN